jgi:hypothetical protein
MNFIVSIPGNKYFKPREYTSLADAIKAKYAFVVNINDDTAVIRDLDGYIVSSREIENYIISNLV